MLITDVRAHHIRIPYDAGVRASSRAPLRSRRSTWCMIEVITDTGLTGWGDGF